MNKLKPHKKNNPNIKVVIYKTLSIHKFLIHTFVHQTFKFILINISAVTSVRYDFGVSEL